MPAEVRQAEIVEIELDGARRVVGRRRAGEGTPIVFLHGLLDSSEGWDEIAAASPRPSVAFDLPGFGSSDLPTRPRVSAYAEDIATAILKLGLSEITLVGHSFGGAVGAAVAERIPGRIASLVLLAPAGFGRIALAEAVSIPGIRSVAAATMPLWLNAPGVLRTGYRLFVTAGQPAADQVVERVRRDISSLVDAAVMATEAVRAAGLSKRAFHRRRVGYHGPVRALWGAADRVVPPSHADGVKSAFPQAELCSWPEMGHHPQRERAANLTAFVETACSGTSPARESVSSPRRRASVAAHAAPVPAAA